MTPMHSAVSPIHRSGEPSGMTHQQTPEVFLWEGLFAVAYGGLLYGVHRWLLRR